MDEEKPDVKELLGRIDELIRILKYLSTDLSEISKTLKATGSPAAAETQRTVSFEPSGVPSRLQSVEDFQKVFPQELAGMLYFEVTDEYVLIKPRQYLGSENFGKIATIIRDQLQGEYGSAGRESHFRIPRKT
jgi:hypothetical protein